MNNIYSHIQNNLKKKDEEYIVLPEESLKKIPRMIPK
jgi:hypothetical protein